MQDKPVEGRKLGDHFVALALNRSFQFVAGGIEGPAVSKGCCLNSQGILFLFLFLLFLETGFHVILFPSNSFCS